MDQGYRLVAITAYKEPPTDGIGRIMHQLREWWWWWTQLNHTDRVRLRRLRALGLLSSYVTHPRAYYGKLQSEYYRKLRGKKST